MEHIILGPLEEVVDHLIRLCFLDFPMLLFALGFHESLMDEFTHCPPGWPVLHHQDMISLGDQVRNERFWPVAVECTFLVEQILDVFPVTNHHRGILEPFEGKNASIYFRPFRDADR